MKRANRVRRTPIASDRGSQPTVTGSPATHDRAPRWSPATPDRVTVHSGRVTRVRRKTETLRRQRIAPFRKPTDLRHAFPAERVTRNDQRDDRQLPRPCLPPASVFDMSDTKSR
jgi:hypothetical protein